MQEQGASEPQGNTIQDRVGTPGCNTGTGHGNRCWIKTGPEEAYDKHRSLGKKASRDPKNNIREKVASGPKKPTVQEQIAPGPETEQGESPREAQRATDPTRL